AIRTIAPGTRKSCAMNLPEGGVTGGSPGAGCSLSGRFAAAIVHLRLPSQCRPPLRVAAQHVEIPTRVIDSDGARPSQASLTGPFAPCYGGSLFAPWKSQARYGVDARTIRGLPG